MPVREGHWLAGQYNCGNAGPACQGVRRAQFLLIAAPSRRERLAQVLILDVRQGLRRCAPPSPDRARALCGGSRWRSGAWRKAMRPIACQPKKRLTRSRMTADRCWISSAAGPSTRSTSVAGSGFSSPMATRPADLKWLAVGGDLGSHDVGPAGNDFGRGKALRLERVAQSGAKQIRKRPGKTARGLAHADAPYAIVGIMTVAVRLPRRKKAATPDPADLARLVRPPRPRLALARPARRTRGSVSCLAIGNHVATDHREGGRALLRAVSVALADSGGARRRQISTMCCAPGRGLVITRVRATCMPAPKWWSSGMAARFPNDVDALRALPGIGDYTAAAVAAIAFDAPAVPVDGNVERVVSRLFAVEEQLPAAKPTIKRSPRRCCLQHRAGDFAQALMDLGATICSPKRPMCALCPWSGACVAHARGDQETFPRKAPKREGKLRRGLRFVSCARRWTRASAPAPGQGLARLDDGSSRQRMDARFRRQPSAALGAASARQSAMAAATRRRAARVHAFSARACGLCRASAARNCGAKRRTLGENRRPRRRSAAERHAQGTWRTLSIAARSPEFPTLPPAWHFPHARPRRDACAAAPRPCD